MVCHMIPVWFTFTKKKKGKSSKLRTQKSKLKFRTHPKKVQEEQKIVLWDDGLPAMALSHWEESLTQWSLCSRWRKAPQSNSYAEGS